MLLHVFHFNFILILYSGTPEIDLTTDSPVESEHVSEQKFVLF